MSPSDERAFRNFDKLPDSAHVRVKVVGALFAISVRSVWRWSRDGRLPAPNRTSTVTGWNVGALRRHMGVCQKDDGAPEGGRPHDQDNNLGSPAAGTGREPLR